MFVAPYAHAPGAVIKRGWPEASYRPHQWALWQALDDTYYSYTNGQASTRQPSPDGPAMNRDRFEAWQQRVLDRWYEENQGRGGGKTVGVSASDWPPNLWLYLYERMVAADTLRDWGES